MATLHVWIEGIVQGVFFRESTRQRARELGLAGWVKNLPDGRVEAVFQGERDACEKALTFARTGPPAARVEDVTCEWIDDPQTYGGFEVRF